MSCSIIFLISLVKMIEVVVDDFDDLDDFDLPHLCSVPVPAKFNSDTVINCYGIN